MNNLSQQIEDYNNSKLDQWMSEQEEIELDEDDRFIDIEGYEDGF